MTTALAPLPPTRSRRRRPASRKRAIHVGPADHGRAMSLDDFEGAVVQEGYFYELNKGVIEASGVPHPRHAVETAAVRNQLVMYEEATPGVVYLIGGGSDAKVMVEDDQSERHPDLFVYLTPPPAVERDVWSHWIPAIVVEVVSESSIRRDYEEKPSEYLAFGVGEYWIVDGLRRRMTAHTRWRGQWKRRELKPTQKYATPLLPGFKLDLARVFPTRR